MAADARCAWWSFHGLNSNFHRGSSVFVVVSSRFSKRSWNESTGSWPRNHGSSERSVKGLSYNDSRLLLIYLQFRNSSTRFDIEYFPPIRNFDPSCDPIPIEMIRRSIQRDFIYRLARRFLSIFHSHWKTFRWWKIVGRKLSRVSTHTHTYTYTYMYILRYTGLMLRYQMWNIFMVSP